MTATYDETLPTDLDWCRAQLGDTDFDPDTNPEDALHSDEHIASVLVAFGENRTLALGQLANELVTRFAQEPVKTTNDGDLVDFTARLPAWQALSAPYLAYLARQAKRAITTTTTALPTMFGVARGRRG